jgi:hypothetical protein
LMLRSTTRQARTRVASARSCSTSSDEENKLIGALVGTVSEAARTVVPWFHKKMPAACASADPTAAYLVPAFH